MQDFTGPADAGVAGQGSFRSPSTGAVVRAVVFDTFGTVVDWRSGVAREVAPFLARYGLSVAPEAFADAWRARYQPAMQAVRDGSRAFLRLDQLHRENLEAVLRDLGQDPAAIPAAELDELNFAWHRLDPWPDSVAGLHRLKARYVIAPLSNGNIALLLNMARRAGIPWDTILGAEVSRAYKPSPLAYTATAEALGIPPASLMLVAAHNGDLRAARQAGLATGFVPRPMEFGGGQEKDLTAEADWDLVAQNFSELATRLGA